MLFDKHSINVHYAGGWGWELPISSGTENTVFVTKIPTLNSAFILYKTLFQHKKQQSSPKHPVLLCCVSTTKKWERIFK